MRSVQASDVYALGGVLYTMLTGRPPSEKLASYRRTKAVGIPKPLLAICGKAMERRPADRYASPLALADDVERWIVRRANFGIAGSLERAGQRGGCGAIGRRRSAAALVLATITVAASVTAGGVSLARVRERRALERAESRADLAVDAVQKFREAVEKNLDVRNRPDLDSLRKTLLAEPLKFFEKLRDELQHSGDTSPATILEAGQSEPGAGEPIGPGRLGGELRSCL